ncbi:MAG: aminopeptidase [Tannerella sp.]|nr:aminopeptidase [Tannerella sp.]
MIRKFFMLLAAVLLVIHSFAATELRDRLDTMPDVGGVDSLGSSFAEKYVFFVTQPIDHSQPDKGSFRQRVVVCHAGFDRPTVIVTEGYGAAYALREGYRDELSGLFDTNIIVVEHRYFLESTPQPIDWTYLTAENSACDLHHVRQLFKDVYPGKWISTGISKGGQTTMIYRAFFPDDVDISVPYVAPLCRGQEDGRHEVFLRKVGTRSERSAIKNFQIEALKRKDALLPLVDSLAKAKNHTFRIPLAEVFDFCVLEYSFAFWQWGTSVDKIPAEDADDKEVFDHLMRISGIDYFSEGTPNASFFVQAAKELGYYGYDTELFRKYLTIDSSKGYLQKIMVPQSALPVEFDATLYHRIYNFLKDSDPKMIFIYGGVDPWSAVHAPKFKKKVNEKLYFQRRGSHRTRIGTMSKRMQKKITSQINTWLN